MGASYLEVLLAGWGAGVEQQRRDAQQALRQAAVMQDLSGEELVRQRHGSSRSRCPGHGQEGLCRGQGQTRAPRGAGLLPGGPAPGPLLCGAVSAALSPNPTCPHLPVAPKTQAGRVCMWLARACTHSVHTSVWFH